jgi:hypothetical protein
MQYGRYSKSSQYKNIRELLTSHDSSIIHRPSSNPPVGISASTSLFQQDTLLCSLGKAGQAIVVILHSLRTKIMSRLSLVCLLQLLLVGIVSSAFVSQSRPAFSRPVSLAVAVDTSEIKTGMTVEIDNEPFKVISFSIMKQARGAAKTTIKFKNLARGTTIENTYRSGEKFETAIIEKKDCQFTYMEGVSTIHSQLP